MRKSVSRTLYLLAIVLGIVAGVLFFLGFQGSNLNSLQNSYSVSTAVNNVNNPALVFAAIALWAVASILALIALIGALVRMAQLGRWGWFVCLLVISGITMLVYIFAGPTTPANQPVYAAPYPQQQDPPQYPRQ